MKMTAVLLVALAAAALLRQRSAALRHWVLAAGIACAATMPLLQTVVPTWTLPIASPAHSTFSTFTTEQVTVAAPEAHVTTAIRIPTNTPVVRTRPLMTALTDSWPGIWFAGMFVSLGILLIGLARLTWLASSARRVTNGRWLELADDIARDYRIERRFLLLQSDHPSLLVTWGLALPKIILPAAAEGWSDERARVVLSHEMAHIRRGDWLVQLGAEILRAVNWFNPLLWVFCRRLRLESEHACDDEVINSGIGGSEYASHLVDLARALNRQRDTWFPAPAMARPSSLERRVRAMLNDRLNRGALTGSTRLLIFVLVFGVAAVVAAAQNAFQTFSGTVVDAMGLPVPGVTLALNSPERQAKYEVKSNDLGGFEFVGLPNGHYDLNVQANGFRAIKDSLTLKGANVQRRLALQIGALEETITVTVSNDDREAAPRPRVTEARPARPREPSACVPSATGGRIVPPKKIRDVAPIYPAHLRGTGVDGQVVMIAKLGVDGSVADVRVMGNPNPDLATSAIEAVQQWRFTPTLLNCTPVEPEMTVTTTFKPMPPAPPPPPQP